MDDILRRINVAKSKGAPATPWFRGAPLPSQQKVYLLPTTKAQREDTSAQKMVGITPKMSAERHRNQVIDPILRELKENYKERKPLVVAQNAAFRSRAPHEERKAIEDKLDEVDRKIIGRKIYELPMKRAEADQAAFYEELDGNRRALESVRGDQNFQTSVDLGRNYKGTSLFPWNKGVDVEQALTYLAGDDAFRRNADENKGFKYKNLDRMTDAEKSTLYYYVGKNDMEKAGAYLDAVQRDLNARGQQAQSAETERLSREHPILFGVPANVGGSFGAPAAYVANTGTAVKNALTGGYEQTDVNSPAFHAAHMVDDSARGVHTAAYEDVKNATGSETAGNVSAFLADTGLSIGQFASKMPFGPLALPLMGAGAAGMTTTDALERGATPNQALAEGTINGAVEILTEKLPVDELFRIAKLAPTGAKDVIKNILKQMGSEGSQEVISELADNLTDSVIMGDKSTYERYVQTLMEQGADEQTARAAATKQFYISNVAKAGFGGALSGGVMAGGASAVGAVRNAGDTNYTAETGNVAPTPKKQREYDMSISEDGKFHINEKAPTGEYTSNRDQTQNTTQYPLSKPIIAPVQGDVNTENVQNGTNYAPTAPKDEVHIDNRTWTDASNRKVKAFQYDHPELHPFFTEAASQMSTDLANTTKGERFPIKDTDGNFIGYTGTKRTTSSAVAAALDDANLSYEQISKALDDLIADHGQENYAAAKKVELVLDTMLSEGYTDAEGRTYGPNEDYLAAKGSVTEDGNDYKLSEEEWASLMEDGNVPPSDGLGAMDARFPYQQKQSKVGTNTFSGVYADVLEQMETDGGNVSSLPYDVISERQSMERANQRLQVDLEGEIADLPNREEWGSEDLDTAMGIMDRYVTEARESKNYGKVNEWAKLIQQKGTNAGQMIQAFAKYTRTPQGILVRAAETLEKAGVSEETKATVLDSIARFSETLDAIGKNGKSGQLIDLIKQQAAVRKTNVSGATEKSLKAQSTKYLYDFALTQLENIALDYEKVSAGQKISTYQAFSHLFNAKTAMRNVVSNHIFDVVDECANNISMVPDAIMGLMTGRRTVGGQKSWGSGAKRRGAMQGARRGWAEVSLDVDMGHASKYGTGGRRTNKMVGGKASKAMSTAEKALGFELNVTDEFHKGSVEAEVLESLTKAVERGDMTQEEAEGFAKHEALYRSFQDETLPGALLAQLKDTMNLIGIGDSGKKIKGKTVHQFGLGDLVQKYTQVPGALMSRAVEFSPIGYGKALLTMAKASKSGGIDAAAQRNAALSIGRATTGTGLAAAFAALAAAGLLSRADDEDDKDIAALNSSEGIVGTQLNMSGLSRWVSGGDPKRQTGDLLISADFLEPINALMTVGALIGTEDRSLLDATFEGTYEAILDTPTMKSFRTLYDTNRYHDPEGDLPLYLEIPIELAKGSVTGFVPGLVRQTAQAMDPTYRDAYTSQDPGQQTVDALKNAIPGLRQTLPVKKTPFGEDKTDKDGVIQRIGNTYLLPGAMKTYRQSPVSKELDAVRKETGSATIYPDRNPPKKVTYSGDDYELTKEERADYQERRGTVTYDLMQSMMDGDAYERGSPEEKAKMLDEVTSYANDLAKREVLAGRGVKYKSSAWEKAYQVTSAGIDFDVYLGYKKQLADLKKSGTASEANSAIRQKIFKDNRLNKNQKGLLDETILSDGVFLPKDVTVDYSDGDSFAVTQMSEAAQKRYPAAKETLGVTPEVFADAWKIYGTNGLKKQDKLSKLRELGFNANEANQLYTLFGKR